MSSTSSETAAAPGPAGYREASQHAPAGVRAGVWVADAEPGSEVVLFLIGMRLHRLRRVRSWGWVARQMPRMLRELSTRPDSALLGYRIWLSGRDVMVSQVWRSAEELGAFARDLDATHAPAWREFNRRIAGSADVGIWHESYVCRADQVETLYANMPPIGLGAAHGLMPVGGRRNSATEQRIQGGVVKRHVPG